MTIITSIILGIVEGATEFIPVSSSGHLVIVRQILGINNNTGLSFDAVLQLATTLALVVYFWKEILQLASTFFALIFRKNISNKDKTLLYSIIFGSIPAVIFGLLLEKQMDTIFRNVSLVYLTLILGSILMGFAQGYGKEKGEMSIGKGMVVGFFQCLALVPGVSRSGATISGGLIAGFSKDEAVKFSFLLSIPILIGSGLKKLFEVKSLLFTTGFGLPLLTGSITAFVVGFISINFLIKYLKKHSLNVFIWYRVALALVLFLIY